MLLRVSNLKLKDVLQLYFNSFIHIFELEQHGMYDIEKEYDGLFLSSFLSSIKKLRTRVPLIPPLLHD